MALNKIALKSGIKTAFDTAKAKESGSEAAIEALADDIALAIDTYVKGMLISYGTGLVAPAGGGTVTGTFGYTLS